MVFALLDDNQPTRDPPDQVVALHLEPHFDTQISAAMYRLGCCNASTIRIRQPVVWLIKCGVADGRIDK